MLNPNQIANEGELFVRSRGRVQNLFLNSGHRCRFEFENGRVFLDLASPSQNSVKSADIDATYLFEYRAELPPEIIGAFRSLARGELPNGSQPLDWWVSRGTANEPSFPNEVLEHLRTYRTLPFEVLPSPLQAYLRSLPGRYGRYLKETVRNLCWRSDIHVPLHPFRESVSEWSLDQDEWIVLPSEINVRARMRGGLSISDPARNAITSLVEQNVCEPIGYELYREALELAHSFHRSALVLAVAAAESAVKTCIAALVPDSQWLVEKLPSPPLVDLLKHYLPLLPTRARANGAVPRVPKHILSCLDAAIKQRNRIVHVGPVQIEPEALDELLDSVHDVLYLCDWYVGHAWARHNLSHRTRKALGLDNDQSPLPSAT